MSGLPESGHDWVLFMSTLLKRSQRPFLGDLGLSCTDCQEQALRRGSVGTDSLLKLPSRPEPPGGSRVLQHCAKRSLLIPLADRSPHSHPPIDGRADDKQRRLSNAAAICLATLTFGNARSNLVNISGMVGCPTGKISAPILPEMQAANAAFWEAIRRELQRPSWARPIAVAERAGDAPAFR